MARGAALRGLGLGALAFLAAAALAPAATAAPPPNDDRASARSLDLPARVTGTTVEATRELTEPVATCGSQPTAGSVWFRVRADESRRLGVDVIAGGDLDAVVEVYLRERSQLRALECEETDRNGRASLGFRAQRGESYVVRVAQLANSAVGEFTLEVFAPQAPARPPGRLLPRSGVRDSVDRVANPSDGWSVVMREGRTYRINLSSSECVAFSVFEPGTSSFEDDAPLLSHRGCGGYLLFTPGPGEGGRYPLLVEPRGRERGVRRYRLRAGSAGADDTAPGVFIRNRARVRGRLGGRGIDRVDLYRFDVARRSDLDLDLDGPGGADFDVLLLTDRGRTLACGCGEGSEREHSPAHATGTVLRRRRGGHRARALRPKAGLADHHLDARDHERPALDVGRPGPRCVLAGRCRSGRRRTGQRRGRALRPARGMASPAPLPPSQRRRPRGRGLSPAGGRSLPRASALPRDTHREPERERLGHGPGRRAAAAVG